MVSSRLIIAACCKCSHTAQGELVLGGRSGTGSIASR